jgi:signal transduction histidine kinase
MQSQCENIERATFEQILTQERLITIGRLTPSIVHEINNPLQAIRGALTLALDDIEKPQDLREYIAISQQEIEHITTLLGQVRLIYRSQTDQPEAFILSNLIRDAVALTHEEAMRQKVRVQNRIPPGIAQVVGVFNPLYIAVLRVFLSMIDAIGAAGGGELAITAEVLDAYVRTSFISRGHIFIHEIDPPSSISEKLLEHFNLACASYLVVANGGRMEFQPIENGLILRIDLPQIS